MFARARFMPRNLIIAVLALCLAPWLLTFPSVPIAHGQEAEASACDDVRYLIAHEITPDDLFGGGGGLLTADVPVEGYLGGGDLGDYWALSTSGARPITLAFNSLPPGVEVEFALFYGMDPVPGGNGETGYHAAVAGQQYSFPVEEEGFYTIVVQLTHIVDVDSPAGRYEMNVSFAGGVGMQVESLRDESNSAGLYPRITNGMMLLDFPSAEVLAPLGGVTGVATHGGQAAHAFFSRRMGYGIYISRWARQISFMGGNLAATGMADARRIFYFESFGYQSNYTTSTAELNNFTDSNDIRVRLDWGLITGFWLLDDCAGIKLRDGHSFVAQTNRQERAFSVISAQDGTGITVRGPNASGEVVDHRLTLDWGITAPGSEVQWIQGVLGVSLPGNHSVEIESTDITMLPYTASEATSSQGAVPLRVTLNDRDATITLDWVGLERFVMIGDRVHLHFSADDTLRTAIQRDGTNLERLEALNGVVYIVYKDIDAGTPGGQRLLLPRSESYIELVTPPGYPAFDGTRLPGQDGYAPRALNNLGGECYPVNTLLPEANCTPNGYPNPANGNLWYAVTDHLARGYLLDLTLTRSYNSRVSMIDGPFGYGWTTTFLLDYDVPFNPDTNSRVVDLNNMEVSTPYRVGLDLTWAPRGVVTFTTPSGSRHVFVGDASFTGGELTALTMPGWTLSRADVYDRWMLRQDDGLTYFFDRAGRLVRYGYPQASRVIDIQYFAEVFDGPGSVGTTMPVIISDAPDMRRLELYYDESHHIIRSVLRDMTAEPDPADVDTSVCDLSRNCFEVLYEYQDDRLVAVHYADGQQAVYRYDESGRLSWHNDPHAPVSPNMRYVYDEADNSLTEAYIILPDGSEHRWRVLEVEAGDGRRVVTVTDARGNEETFSYVMEEGDLRRAGDSFTLVEHTGPLEDAGGLEAVPTVYDWDDGLLVSMPQRRLNNGGGRNTISLSYTPLGQLNRITGGYEDFLVSYEDGRPVDVRFDQLPALRFTYNPLGQVESVTEQYGAVSHYTWDERNWPISRVEDGVQWHYTYNAAGLVETVTRQLTDTNTDPEGFTVRYSWDGLGRLTRIVDPALGAYTIRYRFPHAGDGDPTQVIVCPASGDGSRLAAVPVYTEIIVTDPAGTVTTSRFDHRGRLIERLLRLDPASDVFLRRETYAYDDGPLWGNRVLCETRWMAPREEQDRQSQPLSTHYTYEIVRQLDPLPNGDPASGPIINGYRVTVTDAYGRVRSFTFDALERIREVRDGFEHVTRYDYLYGGSDVVRCDSCTNGLRINQYDIRDGNIATETSYHFDRAWRLRLVIRDNMTWGLRYLNGDTSRLQIVSVPDRDVRSIQWERQLEEYGATVTVRVTHNDAALPHFGASVTYDAQSRPISWIDGEGYVTRFTYCPLPGGAYKEMRSRPYPPGENANFTCDNQADVALALWYDAHNRLIRIDDAFGTRTYAYSRDVDLRGWRVDVTAIPVTQDKGDAVAPLHWSLRANAVGEWVEWIDDAGLRHEYDYDTLGRLRAVTIPDQPEASFIFDYNDAHLLTRQEDALGRGLRYLYNGRGQVIGQQDIVTSNAETYLYGADGLLQSAISQLGDPTFYTFADGDDAGDPSRLTRVVDSMGGVHQYVWNEAANQLQYTDPRGNQIIYHFGIFGRLTHVQEQYGVDPRTGDPLWRDHELFYDDAGHLTGWVRARPESDSPGQNISIQYGPTAGSVQVTAQGMNVGFPLYILPVDQLQSLGEGTANLALEYDAFGRLSQASSGNRIWQIVRTPGEATLTINRIFNEQIYRTTLGFDALFRLTMQADDANDQRRYEYTHDRQAVDLRITQPGLGTRYYEFVPMGQNTATPEVVLHGPGQRVTYVYDSRGLLTGIKTETCIDPLPADTPDDLDACVDDESYTLQRVSVRFTYDSLERLTGIIDEEQNTEVFSYDGAGNLSTYRNANGETFLYAYDALNRLVGIEGPTGVRVLLNYNDNLDRVAGICLARVETTDDYTACANGEGIELETYLYDPLGRLQTQAYPSAGAPDGQSAIQYIYDGQQSALLAAWQVAGASVNLGYEGNGLGLLSNISTSNAQYSLIYRDLTQLTAIGDLIFEYDTQNRVATLQSGEYALTYTYHDDNRGYTIQAGTTPILDLGLDERGFLSWLDYGSRDAVTATFSSRMIAGRELYVGMNWNDDSQTGFRLNSRGEVFFINHVPDRGVQLSSWYRAITPLGQTRRQEIVGSRGFFYNQSGGYIIAIGYDGSGRPLTMRITDRESGEQLYLLTLTYDMYGRLKSEFRQYREGTQIDIDYGYYPGAPTQLRSRQIQINHSDVAGHDENPTVSSDALVFLLGAMSLPWLIYRRRRILPVLVTLCLLTDRSVVVSPVSSVYAQGSPASATYTLSYQYDAAGNLSSAGVEGSALPPCALYTYDSANRLTGVTHEGQVISRYTYDAYHRLSSISSHNHERRFVYQGTATTPLLVSDDGETVYNVSLAGGVALLQDNSGDITRLLYDGRQHSYAALPSAGDELQPIWLFDPLGRFISFSAPTLEEVAQNPCRLEMSPAPDDLAQLAHTQPVFAGMLWDPATNLYFHQDGRAYAPEIGRFLQRDPYGPDALGNIYAYPARQTTLPRREWQPPFMQGLNMLQNALATARMTDDLTASAVIARYAPSPAGYQPDRFPASLNHPLTQVQAGLSRYLSLPGWIREAYNLPGAYVEPVTGALRLPPDPAPGQGDSGDVPSLFDMPLWRSAPVWLPDALPAPLAQVGALVAQGTPRIARFTSYLPDQWRPDIVQLADSWQSVTPQLHVNDAPGVVWEQMPRSPLNPSDATTTLGFIQQLMLLLSERSGQDWLQDALTRTLPSPPNLPPTDSAAWLDSWFSYDTLGVADMLGSRWPVPPPPEVPAYHPGTNPEWLHFLQ